MNIDTLSKAVINDLINDKVLLEAELERVVNLDISTNKKINKIKEILKKITINEIMITKWGDYTQINKN